MPAPPGARWTARLRLEPVAPGHAGDPWRLHLETGELVGRGGLSRMPATRDLTGRIAALAGEAWGRDRLEVGWTVWSALWGRGYATELGRAGLALAFEELGAAAVVAFTERHNRRSRAVMERLGMGYVGEVPAPGLVEGRPGVHDDAPFALYALPATCWR
jgi:RimJ/RimL family protein N-acetyltransferase